MIPTISAGKRIQLQLQAGHCACSTSSSGAAATPLPALLRFVFLRTLPSILLRAPSLLSFAVSATVGTVHCTFQSPFQYPVGR